MITVGHSSNNIHSDQVPRTENASRNLRDRLHSPQRSSGHTRPSCSNVFDGPRCLQWDNYCPSAGRKAFQPLPQRRVQRRGVPWEFADLRGLVYRSWCGEVAVLERESWEVSERARVQETRYTHTAGVGSQHQKVGHTMEGLAYNGF